MTKHHDGHLRWPSSHSNPRRPRRQTRRDVGVDPAGAVRARCRGELIRIDVYSDKATAFRVKRKEAGAGPA